MPILNILASDEKQRIHTEALRVLGKVGCIVDHPAALKQLEAAGARVDGAAGKAFFTERMVQDALAATPNRYRAAGRSAGDGYNVHAGMRPRMRCLGGALNWLSETAGENRPISMTDVHQMLVLADGLQQVDLVGTPFCAEFPSKTYDIHALRWALSGTCKHIWGLCESSKNLPYQMELLQAVCGGRDRLKIHKRISGIVCIIDPLKFPNDEIERLNIYGDYQVPVKWTSSSMVGGNAPYTIAGALVQNVAQFLAALVITAVLRPGTPVVYYITLQLMDMQKGFALFAAPELMQITAAVAQMAGHYRLPSAITSISSTGSEKEQAIFQRSMGLYNCMLAGASEINLCGSLDGGTFFSPEFAVLDDLLMGYLRSAGKRFAISAESLAFAAIVRGIETGEYVSDSHTLQHLRRVKRFDSPLLDGSSHELWCQTGSRSLLARAREKADHIIATHSVEPLDEKLEKELDRIVAAADRALG